MEIKRVWFVSHYSMPPEYEMRVKTQMYAHYLGEKGIDCTIFSASTIHNTNINLVPRGKKYIEKMYDDLKFIHIRCCNYKRTDFWRIKNIRDFASGFYKIAQGMDKPDAIIADTNCLGYKKIIQYATENNVPLYLDIRDLWPLSIVEYLKFSDKNPLIKFLYKEEHKMYQKADGIIFTMEGGRDYLNDRGWADIPGEKVYHINNGINISEYRTNREQWTFDDADLDNSDLFKIIYVGAVRKVNQLKVLCDAAAEVQKDIPKAKFIIFGDGDEREELIDYCKNVGISNVVFKGFVEKKFIPSILEKGDINILNYQVTKVIYYGACQNKLFDYLASGKVTICNAKGRFNLLERYNCGIVTDSFDPLSTAKAICNVYKMGKAGRNEIGKKAVEVAEMYDYKKLTEKLLRIISA